MVIFMLLGIVCSIFAFFSLVTFIALVAYPSIGGAIFFFAVTAVLITGSVLLFRTSSKKAKEKQRMMQQPQQAPPNNQIPSQLPQYSQPQIPQPQGQVPVNDKRQGFFSALGQQLKDEAKYEADRMAQLRRDKTPFCPKCHSTSLYANKKGFGIGKAVVGASTVGLFGLVAGNLGAKRVRITCLNCGKQWMA